MARCKKKDWGGGDLDFVHMCPEENRVVWLPGDLADTEWTPARGANKAVKDLGSSRRDSARDVPAEFEERRRDVPILPSVRTPVVAIRAEVPLDTSAATQASSKDAGHADPSTSGIGRVSCIIDELRSRLVREERVDGDEAAVTFRIFFSKNISNPSCCLDPFPHT